MKMVNSKKYNMKIVIIYTFYKYLEFNALIKSY